MFTGQQIADQLLALEVTHVVTVPDSTIGAWGDALDSIDRIKVVRACREGEAWGIAGGLHLGGAMPLVLIQCTGLFESGDALRNMLFDWKLPIMSIIGYRSYLDQSTLPGDTCLTFTEPILKAWSLDYRLITQASELSLIGDHLARCRSENRPGVALIAEGKA
jgi:sulfopyruvate decarboxylase TPP-binding subunit